MRMVEFEFNLGETVMLRPDLKGIVWGLSIDINGVRYATVEYWDCMNVKRLIPVRETDLKRPEAV